MRITFSQAVQRSWAVPDFVFASLQPGDLGLLSGADGSGKSYLSDIIAATVATGKSVNDVFQPPKIAGRVLMIKGEDRLDDHGRRLQSLARRAGIIECDIEVISLHGERKPIIRRGNFGIETTEHFEWLNEISQGFRMSIIDPLIMFHDLPEDNSIDSLARALIRIAFKNHQTILAVHHASQDAILNSRSDHHVGRGGTALPAACRQVWTLRGMNQREAEKFKIPEHEMGEWKYLANGKASHGAELDGVWLRRDENGILYKPPYHPDDLRLTSLNFIQMEDDDFATI
ncbi:MAG: AAA family ATPase [Burkholderiales bacterium]